MRVRFLMLVVSAVAVSCAQGGGFFSSGPSDFGDDAGGPIIKSDDGGPAWHPPTPDSGPTCKEDGATCSVNGQCCSGECNANRCGVSEAPTCLANGDVCGNDSDCCSGNCAGTFCADPRTTVTPDPDAGPETPACSPDGEFCFDDSECCTGYCDFGSFTCGASGDDTTVTGPTCSPDGSSCLSDYDCCGGANSWCNPTNDTCEPWVLTGCGSLGDDCGGSSICCGDLVCNPLTSTCGGGYGACFNDNDPCDIDGDCCNGVCDSYYGVCGTFSTCDALGEACTPGSCCTGACSRTTHTCH